MHRHPRRAKGVDQRSRVGITQGHAAHQHFAVACADVRQDNFCKPVPGGLRTGVQTVATRGHHQRLHEHPVVHQRATAHDAVHREHQAHGRIEKTKVALLLGVHGGLVALGDAQQPVQAPAVFAAAVNVRRHPFFRVIVVSLLVIGCQSRCQSDCVMHGAHRADQAAQAVALQHIGLPGLGVGARRRAAGQVQQVFDQFARHRLGQKLPH